MERVRVTAGHSIPNGHTGPALSPELQRLLILVRRLLPSDVAALCDLLLLRLCLLRLGLGLGLGLSNGFLLRLLVPNVLHRGS